jgi:1-acyl-sn-glycerol-3-phosphate acyltransferase
MSGPKVALQQVLRPQNWPGTVPREPLRRNVGLDYDGAWSRRPAARAFRRGAFDLVGAPFTRLVAAPAVSGREHLEPLAGPVIFVANHTSHLDTAIIITSLPERFRKRTAVAAAADYFFDRPWKAAASSLLFAAIPVDRNRVNRQSADIAAELIEAGWNLVIYPEGGRSPDGWGQEFRGGAAYLAKRCEVPVVPIHLRGVRPIIPRGSARLHPGKVEVRFGDPLRPTTPPAGERDEDARHFALRVEQAVAALGDEAETDWWSARRRAVQSRTPAFRGPEAAPWRRAWELPASSRRDEPTERAPQPW